MRHLTNAENLIAELRLDGLLSSQQQLDALITLFCDAARSVDPSITKMWVWKDGAEFGQPYIIAMSRDGGAMTVDELLLRASAAEKVSFHANRLAEALNEQCPGNYWIQIKPGKGVKIGYEIDDPFKLSA